MQLRNKQATLRDAIGDWHGRGLIDAATAQRLENDLGTEQGGVGFRGFVILAGVISLCFGVMTFVAANWEEIPRIARLGVVLAALWSTWAGAIYAQTRAQTWLAQSLVLLASGLFGAGIMLVAQLYHIQGEPHDAVFLWMLGTALAAFLTRSVPALALALVLLGLWGATTDGLDIQENYVNWLFLPYWLIGVTGVWWLRSRFSAHVAVIVFLIWLCVTVIATDAPELAIMACYVGSWVVISALLLSAATRRLMRGFEMAALVYTLLFLSVWTLLFYFTLGDADEHARMMEPLAAWPIGFWGTLLSGLSITVAIAIAGRRSALSYDLWMAAGFAAAWNVVIWFLPSTLAASALMLTSSIWVVRMGWRLSARSLRTIGFLGFGGAMLLIYAETIGTLIGTSLFYIGAGAVLLVGAWVGNRLKPAETGVDAGGQIS